jgi:iron complex outermembrane recepter protein
LRKVLQAAVFALACAAAFAQNPPPRVGETIEVTATRIAEDVMLVPASVTVIDGDELRARNAVDLQSALALAAGVSIAPGGDNGPAGSVPEMWGLKEFDAFLLVVDGVPWGGAFNPDVPTVDLTDVDRIEVVRGSAPVMYGATSFVGVIHIIHREPGAPGIGRVSLGSYGSASVAASLPLAQSPAFRSSIVANADRMGFRDDKTGFDRYHALYRAASTLSGGTLHFDADLTALRQDPNSPHPRTGAVLTPDIPLDTNHNPGDARLDENRLHLASRYDGKLGGWPWTTTVAVSRSTFDITRGFLVGDLLETDPNAKGFNQDRTINDVYFDTHIVRTFSPSSTLIAGFDHLYGNAHAASDTFEYFAPLRGGSAQRGSDAEPGEEFDMRDRRNFSGLYASWQWSATPKLRLDLGARLNRTAERREARDPDGSNTDSRSNTRLSGSAGADYRLYTRGRDALAVFADYRDAFKPAAIDFGPEAEADILAPETAISYEAGVKGRLRDGRLRWTASVFDMDFHNLVVATTRNGTPQLENAGNERFKGAEADMEYEWSPDLLLHLAYSYHDARFRDYVQEFDGVPTQLAGKRLEMSPLNLAGAGFLYKPARGFNANVSMNYVGGRFLDRRNAAPAKPYTTLSAGAGYRIGRGEVRVDGRNLNNSRAPVAESELGDAQYYLLPARSVELSYRHFF